MSPMLICNVCTVQFEFPWGVPDDVLIDKIKFHTKLHHNAIKPKFHILKKLEIK